jgi:hypothetical protein
MSTFNSHVEVSRSRMASAATRRRGVSRTSFATRPALASRRSVTATVAASASATTAVTTPNTGGAG